MEQKGEPRIIFPPCLPWKRPLRCPFPPAKRRKEYIMDLVCVCDGPSLLPVEEIAFSCTRRECSRWTSPLPVKEKAISWTWCALAGGFPKRPGTPPEVPGELPKPKHAIIVNNCTTKVMVFGTRSKLYISRCFPVFDLGPGKLPGGFRKPPDLLPTLPVEEKSIAAFPGSACHRLSTLPVEEKTMSGLPQSQSVLWAKGYPHSFLLYHVKGKASPSLPKRF